TQEGKSGNTVDIFASSGAKLGTVKADTFGKNLAEQIISEQLGAYVKETPKSNFNASDQRRFEDYVSTYGNQGATINLISGGKVVQSVTGPNALRNILSYQKEHPDQQVEAQVIYSTTREGKEFVSNLIQGARNVGASSINIMFESKGKQGVVESVPINQASKELPSKIDEYGGNKNITFGYTPKEISSPKDTTLVPASVSALDINVQASKSFTGRYFDFSQWLSKELARYTGYSNPLDFFKGKPQDYPQFTKARTPTNIDETNAGTMTEEFLQNLGARTVGVAKTALPQLAGLEAEFLNMALSPNHKSGEVSYDFNAKTSNPTTLANFIGGRLVSPQNYLSQNVLQVQSKTQEYQHDIVGRPLAQKGLVFPQVIQNPKTFGAEAGTIAGIGLMLIPGKSFSLIKRAIPIRNEPIVIEGRVISKIPSGEAEVEVPGLITVKGPSLGYAGKYSIGVFMKSNTGTKIPILATLRPETPYMREILSNAEPYSERGAEAGNTNKLTMEKLYTNQGAKVMSESGFITEPQQKELVNLGKNVMQKDISKIKDVNPPKSDFRKALEQMTLTGNKDVNVQTIETLGAGSKKVVPPFKGSIVNVVELNYYNKDLAQENAKLYSNFFLSSEKQFPIPFEQSENTIPVRSVESIGDIDADLNINKESPKQPNAPLRSDYKSDSSYQKALEKYNDKLEKFKIKSNEYNLYEEGKSQDVLNLISSNVKTPEGEAFGRENLNIIYGKAEEPIFPEFSLKEGEVIHGTTKTSAEDILKGINRNASKRNQGIFTFSGREARESAIGYAKTTAKNEGGTPFLIKFGLKKGKILKYKDMSEAERQLITPTKNEVKRAGGPNYYWSV
ncbi:MAG: hypothetical protein KGI08_08440, partial [Thaumarchaeota archaeon]|nr:hypothetical protein [Nitrososphaerota archaeon]